MKTITGTLVQSDISKEEAMKLLYESPTFPRGAKLISLEKNSAKHWVATLEVPNSSKVAGPPFPPKKDGPPAPDEDGPAAPSDDPLEEAIKDESEDKLEDKGGDEKADEGAEKVDIQQVFDLVKQIAQAVGVAPELGDGGEEGLPGPHPGAPKPPPPPGAGGPPPGPPGAKGGKPPSQRPLRPGEAPPGTTPVGAPAFASVREQNEANGLHPMTGRARELIVSGPAMPLKAARQELNELYREAGYEVKRIVPATDDDGRDILRAKLAHVA